MTSLFIQKFNLVIARGCAALAHFFSDLSRKLVDSVDVAALTNEQSEAFLEAVGLIGTPEECGPAPDIDDDEVDAFLESVGLLMTPEECEADLNQIGLNNPRYHAVTVYIPPQPRRTLNPAHSR